MAAVILPETAIWETGDFPKQKAAFKTTIGRSDTFICQVSVDNCKTCSLSKRSNRGNNNNHPEL